jgi:hypothetical protein
MATKQNLSRKVDYSLLERFTELLICSGCFKKHEHQPVRQLVSGRHRPIALCHECASKRQGNNPNRAPVLKLKKTHSQRN